MDIKKILKIGFVSFVLVFLFFAGAHADGLVPCGQGDPTDPSYHRCELSDLFVLVRKVYDFLVFDISMPLAALLVVVGGVMLLVSAGNPGLASWAKRILWGALIGIVLIWSGWLIINFILDAIG